MVEEIVAQPALMPPSYCVINGQPAYIPWFNGLLEWQLLAVPIYVWIIFALILIIVGIAAVYLIHWYFMGPVWKYYDAVRKRIDQAIYIGKHNRVSIEPVEYIGAAFRFIGAPLFWLSLAPGSLKWGGINTIILTDTLGIVKDPKLQVAMKTAITQWNLGENATDEEIRAKSIAAKAAGKYQPITDYDTLYNLAIKGKLLPDVIRIPAVAEVPLHELDRYLQDVDVGKMTLAINKVASELTKQEDPNKWVKLLVIGGIIFAVIIVGAAIAGQIISGWS